MPIHQLLHLGVWLQLNTLAWCSLILVKVISYFHLHIFYLDHISKANISVVERSINHPQIINISKTALVRVIKLSDLQKKKDTWRLRQLEVWSLWDQTRSLQTKWRTTPSFYCSRIEVRLFPFGGWRPFARPLIKKIKAMTEKQESGPGKNMSSYLHLAQSE